MGISQILFPYLCSPKQGIAFPVTLCPCAFLNFGKTRLHQPGAFRMLINHVGPLAEITGKIEQKLGASVASPFQSSLYQAGFAVIPPGRK